MDPALSVGSPVPGLPLVWLGVFDEGVEGAPFEGVASPAPYELSPLLPDLDAAEYERRVRQILEWIAAGDTYQVNFTFPMRGEFRGSEDGLYRDLCLSQRSGFCAHLQLGDLSVISASPELFFTREGERIELKPMKGTRPRGRWSAEDRSFADDLRSSPKDRAENLMIVDLLRNDLGRIAQFGSVSVTRMFEVERYPTVHQMTSTIQGRLTPGAGLVEIFQALFPSGSVTGAPKVRATEIIKELEASSRGVYTGAIGFASADEAVFSVAIRTLLLDRRSGNATLGVGSGITADSDPAGEYRECIEKSAFLTRRHPEFELLESLRLQIPGGYPLIDSHVERLASSSFYFGIPFDPEIARRRLRSEAEDLEPGTYKVRLLLDRSGAMTTSHTKIPGALPPASVRLSSQAVDESDPFLFHKTTNRRVYDEALASAPGADDVILYNSRGELTESTTANVVVELDGHLLTPPVECGLLDGVLRRRLVEKGTITERIVRKSDLERALRLYLINAVRGWREAEILDGGPVKSARRDG